MSPSKETTTLPLFHSAIYVNRKPDSLNKAKHGDKPSKPLTEKRAWTSGSELLQKAKETGCELPLIFGYYPPLGYWAVAREISVLGKTTTYRFANLIKIPKGYSRKNLTVINSGKPLPDNFIRLTQLSGRLTS